MKLRTATVFIVIAIITLFATACGGGGGGGGGDDYDPYDGYTDANGYVHPFGGMQEGYYIREPFVSINTIYYDNDWFYLNADGSWDGSIVSAFNSSEYEHSGILRYSVVGNEIHFLEKRGQVWDHCDFIYYLSDNNTSFSDSHGDKKFTFSATPPNPHTEQRQ